MLPCTDRKPTARPHARARADPATTSRQPGEGPMTVEQPTETPVGEPVEAPVPTEPETTEPEPTEEPEAPAE